MPWNKPINSKWITEKVSDETITWSHEFAKFLVSEQDTKPLTTSQLRKFFGKLKQIQSDFSKLKSEIPFLKPHLAYAVGRDAKQTKIKEFYAEIERGLNSVDQENKESFNRFVAIVESIVAYHKFEGGK